MMALVLYRPSAAHGCPPETVQFGYRFGASPVEVSGPAHLAKFAGHPFFEVVSEAPASDPTPPPPARRILEAKHRGRGSYSVMDGDVEVMEGLTKADADAFNALSDDDKEAYVA